MSLKEYNKKRNFNETPEPEGRSDDSNQSRFVVQRHQASHLHYDLRLEIDHALKSWAVPKGPSMNTQDKRLAIQTEDHPISYLTFSGSIPKGNYGAGTMDIWDNGTFSIYDNSEGNALEQWRNGSLKIEFHGKKIKGKFGLFRTREVNGRAQWLLIKKEDACATELDYDAEDFSSTAKKKVLAQQQQKPFTLQLPLCWPPRGRNRFRNPAGFTRSNGMGIALSVRYKEEPCN